MCVCVLSSEFINVLPILRLRRSHNFSVDDGVVVVVVVVDDDDDDDDAVGTPGSGSTNPCYYGKEVGVVHVIGLCSYAGFFNGTVQYNWLQNYLNTSIDRERTPWVIVIMHVPFYCSNTGHWEEGETHC